MSQFITRRFRRGQGLEISGAVQTQRGYTRVENADLTLRDVIRKATGTQAYTPTKSSDPADVIPAAETRAVHARNDEVLLDTENRLYALAQCAGIDTGTTPVGTATPAEIAQASAEIAQRSNPVQQYTVSLPGDIQAVAAQARTDRTDIPPALTTTGPRPNTVTITEPSPGRLSWTLVEGAETVGPIPLPSFSDTSLQRLARLLPVGVDDTLITYLENGGLRAVRLRQGVGVGSVSPLDYGILSALRGAADSLRYEARDGVIAGLALNSASALKTWDAENPATSVRSYAPTVPLPDDVNTGAYAFDIKALAGFAGGVGVSWTSPDSVALSFVVLDPSTIVTESSALSVPIDVTRVGIESSPSGDPLRFVTALKYSSGAQKPVTECGDADKVVRLVANTTTTDIVYTRTSSHVAARWEAAGIPITADRPIEGLINPVDSVAHVDAAGIYLALVDNVGFKELRTDRNLQPPATTTRQADRGAIGLVGSPTRLVYCFRQNMTLLSVGRYTSTQDVTPTISAFVTGADLEASGALAMGILTESGVDDVTLRFYGLDDAATYTVRAATLDTVTGGATEIESHILGTFPQFLSATPLGASPRSLVGVAGAVNTLIYEDSPTLFVQVSPVGTALVSGSWIDRGAWSRLRHRTQRARTSLNAGILQSDAVTCLSAQGVECSLVACEQVGFGVNADILSSYVEFSGNISPTGDGINPRTAYYGGDRGGVGFVDVTSANNIRLAIWTPGDALSFAASGISANGPPGVWDLSGTVNGDGVPMLLAVGCNAAQIVEIELSSVAGTDIAIIDLGQTIIDVCGFCRPAAGSSARGSVSVALANSTVAIIDLDLLPAVNTITVNYTEIVAVGDVPVACSSSIESNGVNHTLWVELPFLGTSREVRIWDVVEASSTPIPIVSGGTTLDSIQRAALYSQQAVSLGQTVGAVELLVDTLAELPGVGAILLIAGRAGEVVGRTARGATSTMDTNTRDDRYPHGSLVPDPGGGLSMGAELRDILLKSVKAVQSQLLRWPRGPDPHRPAVVDAITYAAMGGYPRSYDGERAYETDWHSLPLATATAVVDGMSALTAGSYLVAVTWEVENAQGQLERSAPLFLDPISIVAGEIVQVAYQSLPMTERDRPLVTVWRSIADGESSELLLDGTDFAQKNSGGGLISLFQSDEDLQKAPIFLDQVPGKTLAADRIDATDFMAAANGRIWTVNPSSPTYARYSLQQRDGFALHFSGAALLEHTREETITSVHELSGRVILFTLNGIAYVHGDGPDNTGRGSYTVPMVEPVFLGAVSHSATILTPDGIAYETGEGLRVMSRGLQSLDLGDMVEAHAARDGFVAFALTYTPREELFYSADANPAGSRSLLVFHSETLRWGTWTSPTPKDLATTESGRTVILSTAGLVHVTDRSVYTRGGEVYALTLATDWIAVSETIAHQAKNFLTARGFGQYGGAHDLLVSISSDYVDTPIIEGQRSAANNASIAASGRPYIWQLEIPGQLHYAIRVTVSDTAEPNATWTLEGLDVRFDPTGRIAFGDLAPDQKVEAV